MENSFCGNYDHNKKQDEWQAKWIWLDYDKYAKYSKTNVSLHSDKSWVSYCLACFRKQINIGKTVKNATAYVSADVKYKLMINGQYVGRGPAELGGDIDHDDVFDFWFYDTYDITNVLVNGDNVISAQVSMQTGIQADYSSGTCGFIFEANIEYTDGTTQLVKSDESFKCAINPAQINIKEYDATKDIGDWTSTSYKECDSIWDNAYVINDRVLLHKPIPHLSENIVYAKDVLVHYPQFNDRLINPQALKVNEGSTKITFGCPVTFVLDFGKIHSARICMDFIDTNGTAAGTKVTFQTAEIGGKNEFRFDYIMKNDNQRYETINMYSIRYLTVTIANLCGEVTINNININFLHYPLINEGSFICNDTLLNDIYTACKYTLQLCRQGLEQDSPTHQEPLGCTGDYAVLSMMNYYTFGDKHLTRLDIWRTAQRLKQSDGVMFHTSYSLIYLQMIWDYYMYTGDDTIMSEILPVLDTLMERFISYLGESGVIENAPNYMFMDWVIYGDLNLHHPPKTIGQAYMTAFFIKALWCSSDIHSLVGDKTKADNYKKLGDSIKIAFNKMFWVEERGLYCDGVNSKTPTVTNLMLPPDIDGVHFSQQTNTLAVLFDLADDANPKKQKQALMRKVLTDKSLTQAQPYYMHFVLLAVYDSGLFEEFGLDQIRRWKLLIDENKDSLKEVWFGFDCDYSHAWGGTPAFQLPARVLGITPLEPGYKKILISPCMGDLTYANGIVPTPFGNISIHCKKENDELILNITAPQECEDRFEFNLKQKGIVYLNNKQI